MGNNAKVGGILTIVCGFFGVVSAAMCILGIFMFSYMFSSIPNEPFTPYPAAPPDEFFIFMAVFYGAIGLFFLLVGILAVIGGIFCLKRKSWGMALAGAIAGTVTFFPCGIPAIIFTTLGKPEFDKSEPESEPAAGY